MEPTKIIIGLLLLLVFVFLPLALVIHGAWVERNDDAERRRNSRYIHKGHNKDGNPIYLELPK